MEGYFHQVTKETPTRFWVNNPTPDETDKAIAAGAISCTTNPTYSIKQIASETERDYALNVVDETVKETEDDDEAADLVQQKLVKRIMHKFQPLYERRPGEQGFVSVQGSPHGDDDSDNIIDEALRYRRLGKNIIAKVPATEAGLKAIEKLITMNVPIIATEIMAVSQAIFACELYQRVSKVKGKHPPFYVTHITGIFDDHMKNVVTRDNIAVSPDALQQAGCIVARKQYRILKERRYPGVMLGGGARGLHHFTEMVGGDMHITINWKGTADKLIQNNPPVVNRMDAEAPKHVVDELSEKVPDFRKAYSEDGLTVEEFKKFGPVKLFRDSFVEGWDSLLKVVKERRENITFS